MNTHSIDFENYSNETYVWLNRVIDGKKEQLFVARVRYLKHKSRARAYANQVLRGVQLTTTTQDELDAFRTANI